MTRVVDRLLIAALAGVASVGMPRLEAADCGCSNPNLYPDQVASTKTSTKTLTLPVQAPGSQALLVGSERVRDELGLSRSQRTVLDSIRSDFRSQARAVVEATGSSSSDRKASLEKLQAMTNRFDARAMAVLTPAQRQRLTEIEAQQLGGYLLYDKSVREKLGIDDKQRLKIAKIHTEGLKYASEVNTWFEDGEVTGYERLLYLREDRDDRSDELLDLLTDAQIEQLKSMMGEKFRI